MPTEDSIAATIIPESDWKNANYRARFETVYGQLHQIARRELRRTRDGTLNTTVLVHEAFLKLDGPAGQVDAQPHFIALATKAMRCVLIDHLRAKGTSKRGGDAIHVTLPTAHADDNSLPQVDLLDIERALVALVALDPRLATVVEYHFYGGLEFQEIATLLGVTPRTVNRDWRKARAFLLTHLDAAP